MKTAVKVEEVLGVACMALLVVITLANVLTRYFTDESYAWTEEISIVLMVVMTLAGAASAAARDGHVRIEYWYDTGSARRRRALRVAAAAITALVFSALAVLFAFTLAGEVRWAETSIGLGVPRWWFTAVVPVLCLAIALRAVGAARRAWRAGGTNAHAEAAA